MVTTIKGEKYLSLEECIEKLSNFTKGKVKLDKQHFVALIKTYKNQGINFKTLKHKMHLRLDVLESLMMGNNRYDFINRAMNIYDKQIGYKEQVVTEPSYNNDENDMEKYSKELDKQYQFENRKIVRVNESQIKRLIENAQDEGGIFYPKDMVRKQDDTDETYAKRMRNIPSDYRYVDDVRQKKGDKGLYVDFSRSGLKYHPASKDWVEYPEIWGVDKEKDYETLDNKNPRPAERGDEILKGYGGKYYMPTKKYFGNGDNIKVIKKPLVISATEVVYCYNLAELGSTNATMVAHYYKGKDSTYNGSKRITLNGSEGKYENLFGYIKNMIKIINTEPEISEFNPNYIVYPQSSSPFNGTIAKALKKYIFPNAEIKPNNWMEKLKSWEYDYDDLLNLTKYEVNKKGKKYSNDKQVMDKLTLYTFLGHVKDLITRKVEKGIYDIVLKYYPLKSKGRPSNPFRYNAEIFNEVETLYMSEFNKAELSLAKNGINMSVLDVRYIFLEIMRNILSKNNLGLFSSDYSRQNAKKRGGREKLFASRDTLYRHFTSRNPSICFDVYKIRQAAKNGDNLTNDSIKHYSNTGRLAIKGQFRINDENINNIDKNARFVIIDDNFASGASLRNAAKLLVDMGFSHKNIICITPGDMGQAADGGEKGVKVPYNNAEGRVAYEYMNNMTDIKPSETSINHLSKLNQQLKNNDGHKRRMNFDTHFQYNDKNFE